MRVTSSSPGSLEALDGFGKRHEVLALLALKLIREGPRAPIGLSNGDETAGVYGRSEGSDSLCKTVPDKACPKAQGGVVSVRLWWKFPRVRMDKFDERVDARPVHLIDPR
jgi:hypothetical protein